MADPLNVTYEFVEDTTADPEQVNQNFDDIKEYIDQRLGALAQAQILIGNASGVATPKGISGAISMDQNGVTDFAGALPIEVISEAAAGDITPFTGSFAVRSDPVTITPAGDVTIIAFAVSTVEATGPSTACVSIGQDGVAVGSEAAMGTSGSQVVDFPFQCMYSTGLDEGVEYDFTLMGKEVSGSGQSAIGGPGTKGVVFAFLLVPR